VLRKIRLSLVWFRRASLSLWRVWPLEGARVGEAESAEMADVCLLRSPSRLGPTVARDALARRGRNEVACHWQRYALRGDEGALGSCCPALPVALGDLVPNGSLWSTGLAAVAPCVAVKGRKGDSEKRPEENTLVGSRGLEKTRRRCEVSLRGEARRGRMDSSPQSQ